MDLAYHLEAELLPFQNHDWAVKLVIEGIQSLVGIGEIFCPHFLVHLPAHQTLAALSDGIWTTQEIPPTNRGEAGEARPGLTNLVNGWDRIRNVHFYSLLS